MAAFDHVRLLSDAHGVLTYALLREGFFYREERILLLNKPRGIFKPAQLSHPLSLKTSIPRRGRASTYADQDNAHSEVFRGEEYVNYSFMSDRPDAASNQQLREMAELQIPFIYLLGIAPGEYLAKVPAFISNWDARTRTAQLAFASDQEATISSPSTRAERRYALREIKYRLHQATFREVVIHAYGGRCAVSGLPEKRLLDAAHIIPDRNESLGQPVVSNGIPLSKIHHAAFDAHLIGIDPDYGLHVSERLLSQRDGPMLEALKRLQGNRLHLPNRKQDYPDRNRLALRFEQFQKHVA